MEWSLLYFASNARLAVNGVSLEMGTCDIDEGDIQTKAMLRLIDHLVLTGREDGEGRRRERKRERARGEL